ncbi:N(4)-(Beta-N-acetylglucosaminyl)-L-asparaginase-like isoform X2 [Gordionus sp. m RMFG-2023]
MIMDGESQEMGAVGSLYKIKNAISVARKIMDYTQHSFLVGEAATKFALQMGFEEENLTTNYSIKEFKNWLDNKCQPNFRKNVLPDPKKNCGPYHQNVYQNIERSKEDLASDTVGVIALDFNRKIAIGMSTNGADHKIPGRVGDSPIPGSGGYADNSFGAAVATGDGDIMMRFLPCYQAVENLRNGMTPIDAANNSLQKIIKKIPSFYGAIIVMDKFGNHSASCHGWETFTYTYRTREKSARFIDIKCSKIR